MFVGKKIHHDHEWGYFYYNADGEMFTISEQEMQIFNAIDASYNFNKLMDLHALKNEMETENIDFDNQKKNPSFDDLFFSIFESYVFHSSAHLEIKELRDELKALKREYKKATCDHIDFDVLKKFLSDCGRLGGAISGNSRFLRFFCMSILTQYLLLDFSFSYMENIPRSEIQSFQRTIFGASIKNDFAVELWNKRRANRKKIYLDTRLIDDSEKKEF